ncbi:ABC transporter substrate-binding protein [Bradyrhizobium sp. CCBAU 11386]|uniref:ABC transporter substrate-binding protein n=1 Tax=Bradyrhizobium sp. CCBAU 11386 TaxID=1630837 RepID=UPI0023028162|nr:ABC transporter substrate-binding protein [Bradyrhizobium sp. CCBAU 11386]
MLGGTAAALLLRGANAQTRGGLPPRLGILRYGGQPTDAALGPFLAGMSALGYVEGKTIIYDYRHADNDESRLSSLAAELVATKPTIMMAFGGDIAPYVRDAAKNFPIVFSVSADPVKLGLVASLSRPQRNATGVTFLHDELGSKRLQFLKEAVPRISHVAFLWNPNHLDNELGDTQRAAKSLGVELLSLPVRTVDELSPALDRATAAQVDSIYVVTSTLMVNLMPRIVGYADERALPLIGGWGAWASAGGLMSYGPDVDLMVRRTAVYVDKILKGAQPSDLPVEQPTKFLLTINLKAAKALNFAIPESFLIGADQVID